MSTDIDGDPMEIRLATRLRAEREERGWTLADLAERSGVSRAMVSKIERGEASPTAVLLGRLAAAFGLTLSQLFARIELVDTGQMLRRADQATWRDPETGLVRRSLSVPGRGLMELVWIVFPAGARVDYPAESYDVIADQQIVVMDGELTLETDGRSDTLRVGDAYRFGPRRAVTFRNRGRVDCVYLVAVLREAR